MKIKTKKRNYRLVIDQHNAKKRKHVKPRRPNMFFRSLMRLVSIPDLLATHFKFEKIGMDRLSKDEPAFYLMNHSSFIDLEIAATVLYPKPFNIVTTTDAFFGKNWLMRQIGCIPTKKFCNDTTLVRDILHTVKKLRSNVIMFPEAGYTLDGRTTTLSDTIGKCIKMLGIPLVMIKTYGAFSRDPLYNNLQKRKVTVSATVEYLLSPEEIEQKSADEITEIVFKEFSFDGFKWQKENNIRITEPFRADGLERLLYKCPECKSERDMLGSGTHLTCRKCGAEYELSELGELVATEDTNGKFTHVPDWYDWERKEVREEIEKGKYLLDTAVDIWISVDTKGVYDVGSGRLVHTDEGFRLTSDDGEINYEQKPLASHSICADFNFYEVGDIVALSGTDCIYYCFPKDQTIPVAKVRLAAEELYKIARQKRDDHLLNK